MSEVVAFVRRKGGRPPFHPTEEQRAQVRELAAHGTRHEDIARLLNITPPTLRKHFPEELGLGGIEANAKVARTLFNMATGADGKAPNVAAAIFWLKVRAGWKEQTAAPAEGKKEERERLARTAGTGTNWDGLLR